jgi:Spy/CpxP family protein refolding chaperone
MLNQKKLSLLIAAGLAVSLSAFPVFADDAPAPPPAGGAPAHHERGPRMNMFDRLETQLNLTADQKTTVEPILKDAETQTEAIRKDKSVSREDKRTQTLAIVEGLPDKLNPTLNDDQKAILAKFVDHMKNPPQHKPRNKPAPGGDQPAPGQDG